ncbi:MAG: outer membrane protein assembly factor BamB [Wenzhouxiangella sp.]
MNRSFRVLAILLLVGILAGCQTVGGWFGRDGPEDGPAELVDFESRLNVERLWSVNTGAGINRSRPSFRPFLHDGEVWTGDHRGRVTAVDAETGRVARRFDTGLALSAGPAVYDDVVLLGTFDGELIALDRQSGAQRWLARLSSEMLAWPVLHDGVVIARSIDGRVFGIDVADGSRMWIHDRSVPLLTMRGNSDPLARAGQVYIGYDDGAAVGLRVSDGGLLWEQRVSEPEGRTELERLSDINGPMVVVGTDLYVVTYRGRMASLALESGRILWVKEVASHSGLSVFRTQLASVDVDDAVWLIDRRNGSTLWRDDRLARRGLTRPVFITDYLVTVDSLGYMHWYDLASGDFVARVRASRSATVEAPLVVGNTLYLLDEGGTLSAWRPRS